MKEGMSEETEKVIPKGFINERCLTRRGLEAKLLTQKRSITNEVAKTKRQSKRDDLIELESNDAEGIKDIMDGITSDQVPDEHEGFMGNASETAVSQIKQCSSLGPEV